MDVHLSGLRPQLHLQEGSQVLLVTMGKGECLGNGEGDPGLSVVSGETLPDAEHPALSFQPFPSHPGLTENKSSGKLYLYGPSLSTHLHPGSRIRWRTS